MAPIKTFQQGRQYASWLSEEDCDDKQRQCSVQGAAKSKARGLEFSKGAQKQMYTFTQNREKKTFNEKAGQMRGEERHR